MFLSGSQTRFIVYISLSREIRAVLSVLSYHVQGASGNRGGNIEENSITFLQRVKNDWETIMGNIFMKSFIYLVVK